MSGIINATNLEVANIKDSTGTNTAMTVDSNGIFTFPSTGIYRMMFHLSLYNNSNNAGRYAFARIKASYFSVFNFFILVSTLPLISLIYKSGLTLRI